MKLWHIQCPSNKDSYDVFLDAVVAAETENEAQRTHPRKDIRCVFRDGKWVSQITGLWYEQTHADEDWTYSPLDWVTVTYIGEAAADTLPGPICSNFRPG